MKVHEFMDIKLSLIKKLVGNTIIINNLGMRSSDNFNHKNKKKIIFLGDSVTYGGSIVSNNDLFSEKL